MILGSAFTVAQPFQFLHQAKQGRSAYIKTVRDCSPLIFNDIVVPALAWDTKDGASIRASSTVLNGLLAYPGKSVEDANELFSPIHYPDGKQDAQQVFMNNYQPKVVIHCRFNHLDTNSFLLLSQRFSELCSLVKHH